MKGNCDFRAVYRASYELLSVLGLPWEHQYMADKGFI